MRPQKACNNCNRRKQKCDLLKPCSRCIKLKVECVYNNLKPKKKGASPKFKEYIAKTLEDKWTKVENLINEYRPIIPISDHDNGTSSETVAVESLKDSPTQLLKIVPYHDDEKTLERQLMDLFFKYHLPCTPFINENRVRGIINSTDLRDLALLYAMCTISYNTHNFLSGRYLVSLQYNPFFKKVQNIILQKLEPNLNLLQTILILMNITMGNAFSIKASYLAAEANRVACFLNLHNVNVNVDPKTLTVEEMESYSTWMQCISIDQLTSLFFSLPPTVRLSDLPSLQEDLVFQLALADSNIIYTKEENFYLICHSFHHLVKLKVRFMQLNKEFKSGDFEFSKMEKDLKNTLMDIKAMEVVEKMIYSRSDFFSDPNSTTFNMYFLNYLHVHMFKTALAVGVNILLYQLLEKGTDQQILASLDYRSEAKSRSLDAYNNLKRAEDRYAKLLSRDKADIIYSTHFCYCLGMEWFLMPFEGEDNIGSRKFINLCHIVLAKAGEFWPIIKQSTKMKCDDVCCRIVFEYHSNRNDLTLTGPGYT